MRIAAGNGYNVHMEQINGLGTTWIVRVYRKKLLFRKLISSDWFLDGAQAERFARQLAAELRLGRGVELVGKRAPGWQLTRPPS
jgi:hypothetical protein